MLEHQKIVLRNVADNMELFKKELIKSLAWLNAHEITQLRRWLKENYRTTHKGILDEVFFMSRVAS
ncbi:MAG: hypothetical protein ACOCWM_03860 [Cyclobacteriaceae bacterium]